MLGKKIYNFTYQCLITTLSTELLILSPINDGEIHYFIYWKTNFEKSILGQISLSRLSFHVIKVK